MKYIPLAAIPLLYAAGWVIWYFRFGPPSKRGTRIISFHKISDTPELGGTFCTSRQFESFIKYISREGMKSVSIDDMLNRKSENGILIFFDDAYESVYENAFPVLEKYGFNGVIAPIVSYIGKENLWDRGLNRFRHMSEERIRELSEKGYEIVSHSMSHRDMRKLSRDERIFELKESKKILSSITGKDIKYFMYPYGLYNRNVQADVRSAGYTGAFASYSRRNDEYDEYAIGRHSLYIIDTLFDLKVILNKSPLFLFGHEDAKGRIINWFARFSGVIKI